MGDVGTLLGQVLVVLAAARLLGAAFRRIGQPQVLGEMTAGILLGPSLLGWAAPGVSAWIFPAGSLPLLGTVSQVGLLLFMFLVGLRLDLGVLREQGRAAVAISQAGILVPLALAWPLAVFLYPRFGGDGVPFAGFALFMGASMSVTAFPVLARILAEHGLERTRVGTVALACAAADDVSAWCLLACAAAVVHAGAGGMPPWAVLAGTAAFTLLMLRGARPVLARLEDRFRADGAMTRELLACVLLVALGSAWVTERLGVHAVFGAFLAGAAMPRGERFYRAVAERLEDVVVVLLMPGFFAVTGLRTQVGLVQGAGGWALCGVIVAVAVAGKLGGAAAAARFAGMRWRESAAVGVLMNNRGLVELVILNVGLDLGVIPPALFTMLVLMALVTTFMTTPLLRALYPTPAPASSPGGWAASPAPSETRYGTAPAG